MFDSMRLNARPTSLTSTVLHVFLAKCLQSMQRLTLSMIASNRVWLQEAQHAQELLGVGAERFAGIAEQEPRFLDSEGVAEALQEVRPAAKCLQCSLLASATPAYAAHNPRLPSTGYFSTQVKPCRSRQSAAASVAALCMQRCAHIAQR